jgi:membrane protease subunit HflK
MESVMANTSKVLIDVDQGNTLMYLPIDKLLGSRITEQDRARERSDAVARGVPQTSRDDTSRTRSGLRGRSR